MGATYTRQSSFTDGDVITAAHSNDEFDQILAAFQASSGHTHDGTANEGGPITKMLGTALTLGDGTSGTDIAVTFDGESNDGVLTWMEDEDYFKFSDDILINSTEKLYFQDTGTYIFSNADGDLDLVSDGTNADAIKLASSGGITLDAAGDIILDADGDDITLKNGSATYGSFTNSSGELVIKSGSTPTTAMTFSGANVTFAGTVTIGSAGISEAELEILDGATVTTTELNIMDGDTTASSTTVADADRVVFNDDGTMKQVAVTDLAAYFDDEITAMPNLVTTAATTVGALNSGSITSGFGTIDTGSSTITTTGLITGGSLDIDDVVINGTTIGHTDDTDLITVADGIATVAGEISVTTLDIGGTNVTSTAAEINLIDGGTARGTTAVASGDGILINDGGTMRMTNVDTVSTYFSSHNVGGSNIVTTGALNSGSITSGFGTIDTGSSAITTTGLISGGSLDIDDVLINGTTIGHTDDTDLITLTDGVVTVAGELDASTLDISGNADIAGTTNLDNTDIDGTLVVDGSNISLDSTSTLNIDNSNTSNGITIGTATATVPISIGHSTSEVTVNDNLTVTGDLTVSGTTTTVNSTTVNLNDHNIVLDSGNSTSAVIDGAGITLEGGTGTDATFLYSTTGPKFELKLGSSYEDLKVDQLIADSLDIEGNIDVNGTSNLDIVDIDGAVDMASTLTVAGVVDVTDTTDSSDATGDTGALRTEGGASIAKKLYVGTDLDVDGTTNLDAVDIDGAVQVDNTVTVGEDDTGYDVKFFGATSGQFMLWDESADELALTGDSKLSFHDAAGGENIIASSDGHLEINAGTTLDITAATTQVNAGTLFDVNGDADISGTLLVTGVATLTAKPIANAGMSVKNGSTSAGFVEFFENSGNGTNKVTLIGPASTGDVTLTLPSTAGTVATTASAADEATALAIALG